MDVDAPLVNASTVVAEAKFGDQNFAAELVGLHTQDPSDEAKKRQETPSHISLLAR